jgi:hypothetical protein
MDEGLKKQGEQFGEFFVRAGKTPQVPTNPLVQDPNQLSTWVKLKNLATSGSIFGADPLAAQEFPNQPRR